MQKPAVTKFSNVTIPITGNCTHHEENCAGAFHLLLLPQEAEA
jgi:hypothetical protein